MKKTKTMPFWVLKQKVKGTQVTRIKDKYYLYKISSKWDPKKKRTKKITEEYLGRITPKGLIPPKHKRDKLIDLKKDDKTLYRLQIVKDLKSNQNKDELAKIYDVSVRTISNIEKRFEKDGVKGLIHTRKSNVETIKVSTPEQAAIITDIVQHPSKSAKEIKDATGTDTPLPVIKKLISPVLNHLKLKKKIMLEIQ